MLPEHERTVDVYLYIATLEDPKLKLSRKLPEILVRIDKRKSTDEIIQEIALRKKNINERFLHLLKAASVDCHLWKIKDAQCVPFTNGEKTALLHPFELLIEPMKKNLFLTAKKVTIRDHSYIWVVNTQELYDLERYENYNDIVKVGYLEKKNDKYLITYLKSTKVENGWNL
jgi:hypothetical protein